MSSDILKVAYIHGRTGPHPVQGKLAKSVGGKYVVVDFKIRWHDIQTSAFRRYLSWLVCTFTFPDVKKYDVFLAGGPHFTMVLMRLFKQINRKQKIVLHLGDETLYSLKTHRYSKLTQKMLIWAINNYDAIICEGKMGAAIAHKFFKKDHKIYTVFPGIPNEHYLANKNIVPSLADKNIIFMGNGPSGTRLWYKGLDLMLESFAKAHSADSELKLTIIGAWDMQVQTELLNKYDPSTRSAVQFIGSTPNLNEYLNRGSLYLHCARGEAFGITILIAMLAGLVPIVSEWTGGKEAVEQVSPELVVPLDADIIAKRILWYFKLSLSERGALSAASRRIADQYTESKSIAHYQDTFKQVLLDLGINKKLNPDFN